MVTQESRQAMKCSQCGISESSHRELYAASLGVLTFTFQPGQGQPIHGQIHLCRPCTHEVLSRRILHAAGVFDEALSVETWV